MPPSLPLLPDVRSATTASSHYRPELDGLRAVAVLAVIVFHLNPAWLPGGFTGVDVFFVLSGYLVTSILLRDHAAGRFRFRTFFQRRIARIFPAFLLVALTTLAAGWIWQDGGWDFAALGAAFCAALFSTANLHQLGLGNYFQASPDAQPLLHCWSLSVEEQFYLLFPVVLLLAGKFLTARLRLALMAFLAAASFLYCQRLVPAEPMRAFLLLPSRAWELLTGSLLAMAPALTAGLSHRLRVLLGWTGLAAVGAGFLLVREGPAFPAPAALLPVLGTVAVIAAGSRPPGLSSGPGAALRWLSLPVLTWIGRLSYSLYLWHWPVFSFTDYGMVYESPAARLTVKVILTATLSLLCHHLVENPARTWLNHPARWRAAFLLPAVSLLFLAPAGYAIRRHLYLDASDFRDQTAAFRVPGAHGKVVLLGDSQGSMHGTMLRELCRELNYDFILLSQAGKDPLAPSPPQPESELFRHSLEVIRLERPDTVIVACHWVYKLAEDPSRLTRTLEALLPLCPRLVLLSQPPLLPDTAHRPALRAGSRPPFREAPGHQFQRRQLNAEVARHRTTDGTIRFLDTESLFTCPDGTLLITDPMGRPLFHDRDHLSARGSALIAPALRAVLGR